MKILVTGGTGTVGKEVVKALLRRGASVRVLTRNKEAKLPDGAEVVIGDLSDPVSVAEAIKGVDELFLLIGNVADEFTQALTAYGLSKKAEKAPGEITGFKYLMIWHPRVNTDAAHAWLRGVSGESVRR